MFYRVLRPQSCSSLFKTQQYPTKASGEQWQATLTVSNNVSKMTLTVLSIHRNGRTVLGLPMPGGFNAAKLLNYRESYNRSHEEEVKKYMKMSPHFNGYLTRYQLWLQRNDTCNGELLTCIHWHLHFFSARPFSKSESSAVTRLLSCYRIVVWRSNKVQSKTSSIVVFNTS